MLAEIHQNQEGFGRGFGGGGVGVVGVVTGPTTGESVGDTTGFGLSGLGGGTGDRVDTGSGDGLFGGYPWGSSANTAVALSNNRITRLSHIADLWVECAFMGVLLSSLAALSAEYSCLLEMFLQEKMFRASETGPSAMQ